MKIRRCFGWHLLKLRPEHQDAFDLRQVSAYEAAPGMEAALRVPNAEDGLVALQYVLDGRFPRAIPKGLPETRMQP